MLSDRCTGRKVLLCNRTYATVPRAVLYQDLRGYAHALRASLRELVDDSLPVFGVYVAFVNGGS